MTHLPDEAHKLARLCAALERRIGPAAEWLADAIPDGYPAGAGGSSPIGSTEPSSPTLSAIISTPLIVVEGEPWDLRAVRLALEGHLTTALLALSGAHRLIDAIPRNASGPAAATIAYEQKHSRCEGWDAQHAICERFSVHTATVEGSTWKLCGPCYQAMWKQTEPGPRGRQPRKATA